MGKTTTGFHGFIKVDVMFTEYNDCISVNEVIDNFYMPVLVPMRTVNSSDLGFFMKS